MTLTSSPSASPPTIYTNVAVGNVAIHAGLPSNENFIIDADNISISGGGGRDSFTIKPRTGSRIRITDFESNEIINLSQFNQIHRYADLTITPGSAVISLPNGQVVTIANKNPSEINANNFIFSAPSPDENQKSFWETAGGYAAIAVSVVGGLGTIAGGIWGVYVLWYKCKYGMTPSQYAVAKMVDARHKGIVMPIGISLEEDEEIELIKLQESKVYYDYDNDGKLEKTSWVGSKDGILVYDHNDNNKVDDATEFVLTNWCKEAKTDFEALLCRFDGNGDKRFDKQDNEFDKFKIWQDKNQNGVSEEGELKSLRDAGISYIDFNNQQAVNNSTMQEYGILNTAVVGWEDGKITQAYDLIFWHE
jgi:hypothetical protein